MSQYRQLLPERLIACNADETDVLVFHSEPPPETLRAELGISTGAVGMAIHRMRRRYGELLRDEIAKTVSSPEEVESELTHLLSIIAGV